MIVGSFGEAVKHIGELMSLYEKMRFNKAYVEITNVCNLDCPFCHGTKRVKRFMSVEEFRSAAEKLRPFTEYIYLHIMGEPLLHPELSDILGVCASLGFRVSVTTNGTLLDEKIDILLSSSAMYRICVSLHSFEVNAKKTTLEKYIASVGNASLKAKEKNVLFSMRLWNGGGDNSENGEIFRLISSFYPPPYRENARGTTLADGVFIEYGEKFDWPDVDGHERKVRFCMALRDQIGVLCDGTVVPCCLDADGEIPLGNIFTDDLTDIITSERATTIINGFSDGKPSESLCQTCGFAELRFGKK